MHAFVPALITHAALNHLARLKQHYAATRLFEGISADVHSDWAILVSDGELCGPGATLRRPIRLSTKA